jgi:transcriptional antiterminator NusG
VSDTTDAQFVEGTAADEEPRVEETAAEEASPAAAAAEALPTGGLQASGHDVETADDVATADGVETADDVATAEDVETAGTAETVGTVEDVGTAEDETEEVEEDEELPREPSPADRPGKWFVVHTQSGYEKKVQSNLEARIQSMNMEEKIFEVVIPMEDVVEFKGNQKRVVQKKVFPGYLLVRCSMDDESWYVIRNTPGVTGFVGQGRFGQKPTPLTRREVESFLAAKTDGAEPVRQRKAKLEFEVGDNVRVKEGPFADFSGQVAEINPDHLKLKVLVNIFGRETLVEMDFGQVAKI